MQREGGLVRDGFVVRLIFVTALALLAEKKANELPVKMVIPLALGIFPVILMICLLPVILKLLRLIAP